MTKKKSNTEKNITTAFILNLAFAVIELIGGLYTNSVSIISDAVHDTGDAVSLGLAATLEKKSKKAPTEKYTFGYLRYSVLGAFITSMILIIGAIIVLYNAIPKLIHPVAVNYDGMIILAIIGVIINGFASFQTSHGHSLNEKAVNLHMFEDVLGWAAVLVGSIVIKYTGLYIIDPIMSIGITIYILWHVVENVKKIMDLFLIKSPENYNKSELEKKLLGNNQIKNIHHVHAWSINGETTFVTLHVALNMYINSSNLVHLKKKIKQDIQDVLGTTHATIEFDFIDEECNEPECIVPDESSHIHTY